MTTKHYSCHEEDCAVLFINIMKHYDTSSILHVSMYRQITCFPIELPKWQHLTHWQHM